MQILSVMIYALIIISAIILVCLILMQPSKSGGLGASFGGGGGATESVFGAHAMGHLSKLTVIFISIFFVLTLAMAVISAHSDDKSNNSLMGTASVVQTQPSANGNTTSADASEEVPAEQTAE